MVIAVNTRLWTEDRMNEFDFFAKELILLLTEQHREHHFYFLFDRPHKHEFVSFENVTSLIITPAVTNLVLSKYWFDIKLPAALKKIKADVFFSPDGICSLTTKLPQCLLIPDLAFLHQPALHKKIQVLFNKKYTPKFLKKANKIITISESIKKDITYHYKIDTDKIEVIYQAVSPYFRPLTSEAKQTIKEKYTEGKEYFVYSGIIAPHKNIINLWKAFSLFKKRQRSNWKLVLSGKTVGKNDDFLELLKTYKHRDDIVLTGMVAKDESAKIIGAAYAVIHPSLYVIHGSLALQAMKCNVPFLASANTITEGVAGNAALYFDGSNPGDIAEKLMIIYKDESLRYELIEKGKQIASEYALQRTADLLWKNIYDGTVS